MTIHGTAPRRKDGSNYEPSFHVYCRLGGGGHQGSYIRGVQVLRPRESATELGTRLLSRTSLCRLAAHRTRWPPTSSRSRRCPCSPVFFNAQVLDKYKADPRRSTGWGHRSINCRQAWSLQTYDINEAGQVHTCITHLGNLPYREQLY